MRLHRIALVGLCACDAVFGLELPDPVTPGPRPPPTCVAAGDRVELPLLADTYLVEGDPSPHGGEAVLRTAPGRSVLARFDPGSVVFNVIEVTFTHPGAARGCDASASCASCPIGATGTISLYVTRPDWDEASATHLERAANTPWAAPGAGGADRRLVGTHSYRGTDLAVSTFVAALAPEPGWPAGPLSIQLAVEGPGADAVFGSREGATSCGQAEPARAIVTCQSASTCGNGTVDTAETCDDRNRVGGDGCSAACLIEACGNGVLDAGEDCDDGNDVETDGCSNACRCGSLCQS